MSKLVHNKLRRIIIYNYLAFLVFWVYWHLTVDDGSFQSISVVLYSGLISLCLYITICGCIVYLLKLLKPVFVKDNYYERLSVYKERHIGLKLFLFCCIFFGIYFTFIRIVNGVSITPFWLTPFVEPNETNPFVSVLPIWLEPINGLIKGVLLGVVVVLIARISLKKYDNEKNGTGYIFYD